MNKVLLFLVVLLLSEHASAKTHFSDTLFVRFEDGVEFHSENVSRGGFTFARNFTIYRQHKKQKVFLFAPQTGTSNTIEIYREVDYLDHQYLTDLNNFMQRKTTAFMGECNGKNLDVLEAIPVDLTGLKNGKYIARYISCSNWGIMKISIAEK